MPCIHFIRIGGFKFTFVRLCGCLLCCPTNISSGSGGSSLPLWGSVDDPIVAPAYISSGSDHSSLPLWGSVDDCLVAKHIFHLDLSIQVYLCEAVWMIALLPRIYFIRIRGFKFTFVRQCGWSLYCPAYISSRSEHSSLPLWGSVDDCLVAKHIFHLDLSIQVYLCEAVWMIALLPRIYFIWIWGVTPFR